MGRESDRFIRRKYQQKRRLNGVLQASRVTRLSKWMTLPRPRLHGRTRWLRIIFSAAYAPSRLPPETRLRA
jgi:hypothetical protein